MRFRRVRLDDSIHIREPSRSQHLDGLLDAPRRPHALTVLVIQRDSHAVEEAHAVDVASVRTADVIHRVRVQVDVDHGHAIFFTNTYTNITYFLHIQRQ